MWTSFGVTARAPDPPVQVQWPSRNTSLIDKFHRSILSGKLNRIRDLYNKGVSIDTYNEDGQTGLFCAAYKGGADVVALLLSLGAKPNARCQPEGYTPVHGACYFGCTQILKLLLQAGGDLRLCDSQRRTPMDWCRLQSDSAKIQSIVNIVEGARSCVTKTKGIDLLKGIQSSLSPRSNKAFVEMVKSFIRPSSRNRQDTLLNLEELSNGIHSTGFGKVYFGSGERCAAVIGIPYVSEVNDLQIEKDENIPSWACGKFTTFHPRQWTSRRTAVSVRELNKMAGNDCVPDILITELEIRSKLHHPNLLMLLGVCQTQKCESVSLLYERIQLGSLHSILHDRSYSLSDKFKTDIVIQMCEALEYVHSLGIVHCGLTSHAIILVNKRQAKLSCFEYSLPDGTNSEETLVRHPILTSDAHLNILRHWMAPEVLIKQRFSVRSDIYSLACVMWELCHEEIPWHDFSLPTLRKLFSDTHETLPINTPSKCWSHVLEIGLRVHKADRDLEIEEIIYMMNKNKQLVSKQNYEVESSFNGKASRDSVVQSRKFAGDENLDTVDSNNSKKFVKPFQKSIPSFRKNQEKSKKYYTTESTPPRKEILPNRTCQTLPTQNSVPSIQGIIKKFGINNKKNKATCTKEISSTKEATTRDHQLIESSSLSRNFKLPVQEKSTETIDSNVVKQNPDVEKSPPVKLVGKRMKNDGTQTLTSCKENSHRPVGNSGTQTAMTEKLSNYGREFQKTLLDSSSSVVSSSTPTSSIPPDRSTSNNRANDRPQKTSRSSIKDELNRMLAKRFHVAEDRKFLSLQLPAKKDSKKPPPPAINPSIKPASHFIEGVQRTTVASEPWNYIPNIPMNEGDKFCSGVAIKPAGHALSHQTNNGKNLAQKVKSYTVKLKRKFQLSFQDSLYAKYSTRRELSTEQLNLDDPVNLVNSRSTLDISTLEHDEQVCPISQGFVYKTAKEFDAVFASRSLESESKEKSYYNKESQTGNLSSSFDGIKKNTRSVTSQCSLQLMSTVNQSSFLEGFESSVKSSNSVLHSTPGTRNDFRVTRLNKPSTSNCVVKDSENFEFGEGEPAGRFLAQPSSSTRKLNNDSFTSHPINTQLIKNNESSSPSDGSNNNNNNEGVTTEFSSGNSSSEYMYRRDNVIIETEEVDGELENPGQISYIIQTGRRNSDVPNIRTSETDEEEEEEGIHSEELGEYDDNDDDDVIVDENYSNDVKNNIPLEVTGNENDLFSPRLSDRTCKHCLSNST